MKGVEYVILKISYRLSIPLIQKLQHRCDEDYLKPITKLIPVLKLENDPETIIITFDDDILLDKKVVKILYSKMKQYKNKCVVGFSGVCVGFFPFFFQFVVDNEKDVDVD